MVWKPNNPEGREALKVKYDIVPYTRGKVLDLGCGPWKPYSHFIGVDTTEEWDEMDWQPDINLDCTNLSLFASQSVDSLFSSHLLEHIEDTYKTLKEWWRVIKVGGYLVLYLPHKDFYPTREENKANVNHKHDFHPKDIIDHMKNVGSWDLVVSEPRNERDEYSFLQVFKKIEDGHYFTYALETRKKRACVCRYGGIGDMIQTASILPGLKKQGYHVTVMTIPRGQEILKKDPNIDEFIIQDTNQVPNEELPIYWDIQAKKFDKFINLSESVEGTFLAIPGRVQHQWPKHIREKYMNKNYLEFVHELADVPFVPASRFYPSVSERKWAAKIKHPSIIWVLSGSSVHKTWPYLDSAIARILLETNYHIYMVGDEVCQVLEQGWENEKRVHRKSGKWNVRQVLAFAERCDMVIGPETGIMNAVGLLDVIKILFLSHSSIENLSKHWKNCIPLTPDNCHCYPCHKLHYTKKSCSRDEQAADDNARATALCQSRISLDKFWNTFKKAA